MRDGRGSLLDGLLLKSYEEYAKNTSNDLN